MVEIIASSNGSAGTALGGFIAFVLIVWAIWWGFKKFRGRTSESAPMGHDGNLLVRGLKGLMRIYTLPFRLLTPFMSSTGRRGFHGSRLRDLQRSDRTKARDPAGSDQQTRPVEEAEGGFELPKYGPIDPTDRD